MPRRLGSGPAVTAHGEDDVASLLLGFNVAGRLDHVRG